MLLLDVWTIMVASMISQRDENVKKEILEAAKRAFQIWGLNKTTMEDIAREANKGKSTLYNYYDSKEEIFESLAMQELAQILRAAKDAVAGNSSAKEKLRGYITTVLVEIKKTASIYSLIHGDLRGKKEFLNRVTRQIDKYEGMIILDILEEGMKAGEFANLNEANKAKAAEVLVGIIRGLELYLFIEIDDMEKLDIATMFISNGI